MTNNIDIYKLIRLLNIDTYEASISDDIDINKLVLDSIDELAHNTYNRIVKMESCRVSRDEYDLKVLFKLGSEKYTFCTSIRKCWFDTLTRHNILFNTLEGFIISRNIPVNKVEMQKIVKFVERNMDKQLDYYYAIRYINGKEVEEDYE